MKHKINGYLSTLLVMTTLMPVAGQGLRISTEPAALSATLHEPLVVQLVVTNTEATPRKVTVLQQWELELRMQRLLPSGEVRRSDSPVWGRGADVLSSFRDITLRPGESYRQPLLLNEWFDFDEVGGQTVHIEWPEQKTSTDVSLAIGPRDAGRLSQRAAELLKAIQSGDREQAPRQLSAMKDEAAVPALSELANNQLFPYEFGIKGLEQIGSPASVAALGQILRSGRRDAVPLARSSLGRMRTSVGASAELRRSIDGALGGR